VQTTLLGLAIAVILALLAALIGPFFVDWNQYRSHFETEATRRLGLPVRVAGSIDVRLLPSPILMLNGIEIGPAGQEQTLRARALGIEFALGALLRGEFRAAQLRLVGPQLTLGLDKDGRLALPQSAGGAALDTLSIERMNIEDAQLALADARNDSRVTLEKLWFNGEVRSLTGPIRGDGAFISSGGLYSYRVAASLPESGGVKLKLRIDPSDQSLSAETDGILTLDAAAPRFEGSLTLARALGAVTSEGRAVLTEPWRITSGLKANPSSALFEQLEFQYGAEQRAIKLAGTAELAFGSRPRLQAVLSARQLDLDRLIASPEAPTRLPFAAMKELAERFSAGLQPPIPTQIGFGIDAVTLGGAAIQSLRGDLKIDQATWTLEGLEFRAPGAAEVKIAGQFNFLRDAPTFTGPIDVASADPRALLGWLEGRSDLPAAAAKPFTARGEVTLGREKVAIERLQAEFERKGVEGRLAYAWATASRKARLDAELRAAELDVDAMLDFAKVALGGTMLDRPGEMALALDLGRAKIAGLDARDAKARLKFDGEGLHIERLAFADLGGIKLDASGRIDLVAGSPRGNIALDADARELSAVSALFVKFAPDFSATLRQTIGGLGPAKLHASLNLEQEPPRRGSARTSARLGLEGSAGGLRVSLKTEATGGAADILNSEMKFEGRVEAADDGALIRLLGLDRVVAGGKRPGRLSLLADGPLTGALRVDAKLVAGNLDAAAKGTMRLSLDQLTGIVDLAINGADVGLLRFPDAGRGVQSLPVNLTSRVAIAGRTLNFENLSATIAGTLVRGQLKFAQDPSPRIDGAIEADAIDAGALLGAAIGMPRDSADPFTRGFASDLTGKIELRAKQAAVTPALAAQNVRALLVIKPSEVAVSDIAAELGGGQVSGEMSFRKDVDGLTARGRFALRDADASLVIPKDTGLLLTGRIGVQVEAEGTGLTPKTLLGALAGNGVVTLESAEIARLDPEAFPAVMRAADQGLALNAAAIAEAMTALLDAGRLKVAAADGAITIGGGQVRLGTVIARAEGADLAMSGTLDLADNTLDVRMTLAGSRIATSAGRPEIAVVFKGPLAAPKRILDASALAGWLALRAVEEQAKRLEAIERQPRSTGESPQAPQSAPATIPPAGSTSVPRARAITPAEAKAMPRERAPPLPAPLDIKPAPIPRGPAAGRSPVDLPISSQP